MKRKIIKNIFTPSHQTYIIEATKKVSFELNANFVGSYGAKSKFNKEKFTLNQLEMLEGRIQNKIIKLSNSAFKLKEIEKNIIKRNNESKYKLNNRELQLLKGRIIESWEFILNKYNIDCILFEDIPHQLSDWILYELAHNKKILCVGLVPILGSKGLFSWTRYDEPGIIAKNCIKGLKNEHIFYNKRVVEYIKNLNGISHKESVNKFLHDQNLDFIFNENSEIKENNYLFINKLIIPFLKKNLNNFKDYLRKIKYNRNYPTDIWLVNFDKRYNTNYENYLEEIIKSRKKKENNFKIYNKLSIQFNNKKFKKFVIVCLQFQPEVSTTPIAYPFDSVNYFLKNLRKNLNKDITILIKEHPSQFSQEYARYPEYWRDESFYKNIYKFHNTFFLSMDTDLFNASNYSICIFNFGGNIGCEMILREKHIANIGSSWYSSCISEHTITNEIELENYSKNINKMKKIFELNSKNYKKIFNSMCRYSCFGIGGSFGIKGKKEFFKMNKIDEEQNAELISKLYLYEIKNL